jgi:biopolymer transport protein TolQ
MLSAPALIPTFGGIIQAFSQSDIAGKSIVLLLLVFSVVAWTVMIGKYRELKRMRDDNMRYEMYLMDLRSIFTADRNVRGPYAMLVRDALDAYEIAKKSGSKPEARIGYVENALQRGVGALQVAYDTKMVLLGSIVTGAPFMGLLGTVWGVMDCFGAISMQKFATLQMLAPGVSGALVTTVAGLLVAIPSVFGYNFLLTQNRRMATELENFAGLTADRIELESTDVK